MIGRVKTHTGAERFIVSQNAVLAQMLAGNNDHPCGNELRASAPSLRAQGLNLNTGTINRDDPIRSLAGERRDLIEFGCLGVFAYHPPLRRAAPNMVGGATGRRRREAPDPQSLCR